MLPERDMSEWLMSTMAAAQLPAQSALESPSNDPLPEDDVSSTVSKPAQAPVEIQRKRKRNLEGAEETDLLPPRGARLLGGAPRRRRLVVEDSDEEDTSTGQAAEETPKSPENSPWSSSMPQETNETIARETTVVENNKSEETTENTEDSNGRMSSPCKDDEAVADATEDSTSQLTKEKIDNSNEPTSSSCETDKAVTEDVKDATGSQSEENTKDSSGRTSSPRKADEAVTDDTMATTETSEPTRSSPEVGSATQDQKESGEKSAEDSSSREPTSSSPKAADSSDSKTEITPPASDPEVSDKAAESSQTEITPSSSSTPEESENAAGSGEKEASKSASKQSTRTTEKETRCINGLVRVNNQCFSNTVIQMFDAALEGHNVDAVLGPVKPINPFADPPLTPDDVFGAAKPKTTRKSRAKAAEDGKKPISKLDRIKGGILKVIGDSRKKKNWRVLSPKRHLRSLVHKLRSNRGEGSSRWLNGYVFQHVLAHGDENASRSHLDGLEQQDCYEYYQALIDGVDSGFPDEANDSSSTHGSASLRSLVEVSEEETTVCKSCGHRGVTKAASSIAVSVIVPKQRGGTNLTDLLKETTASDLDLPCPNCGQKQQRETEITGTSDNLVVHLNRIGEDMFSKTMSAVHLPMQPIDFAGNRYVLNAVVKHEGPDALAGHYTILRRRSPDWVTREKGLWWRFDDHVFEPIEAKDVKDGIGRAQSVMLLFKAL